MFCVKCGNPLTEGQQFCTNCGNKLENNLSNNREETCNEEKNIPNNEERNVSIEETSAKILSDVSEKVNDIVDKGKDVVGKMKLHDRIKPDLNGVKKKTKKIKIFGVLAVSIIILFVCIFTMLRSTPEKTVKKFAKAIENIDISNALKYTNYEKIIEYNNLWGGDSAYDNKDKIFIELQKEFIENYGNAIIKIDNIEESFKFGDAAEVTATVIIKNGTYIDSDYIDIMLVKEDDKWVIDITDFDYFW